MPSVYPPDHPDVPSRAGAISRIKPAGGGEDGSTRAHSVGSSGRPARGLFLRASRDIEYVKQHGRRVSSLWFNLLVCRSDGQETKVGIVVGRRFGTAVSRNRVKRRFREMARSIRHHLVGGYSMVVFPKRDALTASFQSVKKAWCSVLLRQGVLRTEAE